MYPNWLIVLNAIILLISFWTKPHVAAIKAVIEPIKVITNKAVGLYSKIGLDLTNKYNPAVTRVAAWISADTGVGFISLRKNTYKPYSKSINLKNKWTFSLNYLTSRHFFK